MTCLTVSFSVLWRRCGLTLLLEAGWLPRLHGLGSPGVGGGDGYSQRASTPALGQIDETRRLAETRNNGRDVRQAAEK